jgi:hypothetical protein
MGPSTNAYRAGFLDALAKLILTFPNIVFESMCTKDLRKNSWTSSEFFDWLLQGQFHILFCHLHQSIHFWSISDIRMGLNRLTFHPGFPSGEQCQCPVITQDKFAYLSTDCLLFNPTMKIVLPFDWTQENVIDIQRFMLRIDEGKGWVVKMPYVTNTKVKFCRTFEQVLNALDLIFNKGFAPYAMLQACMINRREYKVVCLNSEPIYIAHIKTFRSGKSFSTEPHTLLFEFVRSAIQSIKASMPGTFTEALFRVDVFKRNDGRLVVNEFENMEAGFESSCENEAIVHDFIRNFWNKFLTGVIK